MPLNVKVIPGNKAIRLTWDPPSPEGKAQVIGYVLQNLTTAELFDLPASPTSVVRDGLINGQEYRFMLRAVSSSGLGSAVITQPVAPYGVPTEPLAVDWAVNPQGGVTVSWQQPVSNGGSPITKYIVRARGTSGSVIKQVEAGANATSAAVTGLPPSTTITFRVVAVNAGGEGIPSDDTDPYVSPASTGSPTPSPAPTPTVMPAVTATAVATPVPTPAQVVPTPTPVVDSSFSALHTVGPFVIDATPGEAVEFVTKLGNATGLPLFRFRGLSVPAASTSGVEIFVEVSETGPYDVTGDLTFRLGSLSLSTFDGRGIGRFRVSETSSVVGVAEVVRKTGGLSITISNYSLLVEKRADMLGGTSARFEVQMPQPGPVEITAVEFVGPDQATVTLGRVADLSGIEAVLMGVSVTSPTGSVQLGDNRATFSIPTPLLGALFESSDGGNGLARLSIIKTEENGRTFIQPASCELLSGYYECSALFTGEAGGFSTFFVVLRSDLQPGDATVVPGVVGTSVPASEATVTTGLSEITSSPILFPTSEPLRFGSDPSTDLSLWIVYGVLGFFTVSGAIAAVRIFWFRG